MRIDRGRDCISESGWATEVTAKNAGIPDVWIDRVVPFHLPAPFGTRSPSRLDRQSDSERRSAGGARGWHALCARRAGRTRASWRAGVARLLERPGEDGGALL